MITCTRRLEWDMGHRVLGHQGKCIYPHGHRYRCDITAHAPRLDKLGMVIDFGVLKARCGSYIDDHLDHGFMIYEKDHELISALDSLFQKKLIVSRYNPTAENIAQDLLDTFNSLVIDTKIQITSVLVYETPNCWARATSEPANV